MEREDGDRGGLGEPGGSRYRRVVQALVAANVAAAIVLAVVLFTGSDDEPETVVATTAPPTDPAPPPAEGPAAAGPADPAAPADSAGAPGGGLEAGGQGDAAVGGDGAAAGPAVAGAGGTAAASDSVASAFLIPPEEFAPVADATAGTGPLDLEDVVRLDASDATLARSRFVELGFRSAHSRAWQTQTDSLLVVAYEFADERGAATFVGEASALRRADPAAAQIALPGVPGAAAFQLQLPGDPTQAVFLSRGPRAYLVGLVGPSAADPQAELLRRLATAQYEAAL